LFASQIYHKTSQIFQSNGLMFLLLLTSNPIDRNTRRLKNILGLIEAFFCLVSGEMPELMSEFKHM